MLNYEEFIENNLREINFEDAFDISELQELQDVLTRSLQIASIITDVKGNPITRSSNFCKLCNLVRKSQEGMKNCMYSDAVIGSSNMGGYTVSKCLSVGLMDAGVPIMVGDRHVANWLFGQILDEYEEFNEIEIREKAEELGADAETFIEAYKQVPVIPRERFESIAQLVYIFSKQLSEQAYQRCVSRADEQYRKLLNDEVVHQKEMTEYANSIDELTGLNNRNYFEKQIKKLDFLGVAPVAVVMGDVNHLKLTNDVFGHRHGDQLLRVIAEVMIEESFDDYIICRCGGDEFNVILPNSNRSDAEWYCKRVRIELAKRTDCCVMPSIAFGVGKKSHKHESLKNVIDIADVKMYRDKVNIKENEDIIRNMQHVLLARGFLSSEYQTDSITMARRFGEYLGYNEPFVKDLTKVVKLQDYGYLVLEMPLFEKKFHTDLIVEEKRELKKHPILSAKISKMHPNYEDIEPYVLSHEEHWDGSGYPNHLEGEAIPLLSRLAKLVGDYNLFVAKPPIGMGVSSDEAVEMISKNSGTIYDPVYEVKFIEFLKQDKKK